MESFGEIAIDLVLLALDLTRLDLNSMDSLLYTVNEKILCFHGPLIYQAKVLKAKIWTEEDSEDGTTGPHYFVHYQGWKQSWDEWVPESRMLKFNEENQRKRKALIDSMQKPPPAKEKKEAAPRKSVGNGKEKEKDDKMECRGTKRARETVEQEDEFVKRPEIRINIPDALKVQLVDDWENVTKNNQLVPLPRKPCVQDILKDYREHYLASKKDGKARPRAVLEEVISGLQLYFDKALGQNLLYKFERAQYVEARKQHVPKMAERRGTGGREVTEDDDQVLEMEPSKVYGAEHLLRLFVNLPGIIAHTSMDADSIALLKEHLGEFLTYMMKEQKRLFVAEYESASPAYHRLSTT